MIDYPKLTAIDFWSRVLRRCAERGGWELRQLKVSNAGRTIYASFRHREHRSCCVRVSDHAPGRFRGSQERMYSVTLGHAGRLVDLAGFLMKPETMPHVRAVAGRDCSPVTRGLPGEPGVSGAGPEAPDGVPYVV